jgi:hypothetical protein
MCKKCADALKHYFPDLPEEEAINVLWCLTAFPFGTAETIRKQLKHVKRIGIDRAYQEINDKTDRVMRRVGNLQVTE